MKTPIPPQMFLVKTGNLSVAVPNWLVMIRTVTMILPWGIINIHMAMVMVHPEKLRWEMVFRVSPFPPMMVQPNPTLIVRDFWVSETKTREPMMQYARIS